MKEDIRSPWGRILSRRGLLAGLVGAAVGGWFLRTRWLDAASGLAESAQGNAGVIQEGDRMDFNAVTLGDHIPNPCTPETPEDFVGLRIAAPDTVVAGQDQFAICGTYRFPAEFMYKFPNVHWAIVLVAVHAESHRPYAANLQPPGASGAPEEPPEPFQDPDWMRNHFVQRYLNVDLLRFLPEVRETPGEYFIYTVLDDQVSNVVRVVFTSEEGSP